MPYLSDDEIDGLVSRAVSKAIGNRKEAQRAANRDAVVAIVQPVEYDDKMIAQGGSGGFSAACIQELPTVLAAGITLQPGESMDVLGAQQVSGTVLG